MALGLTQPLIEMSTKNIPGELRATGEYAWHHRHLWTDFLENVGFSTSHNLMGLHGQLQG
jgi:hypothetical protein